MPTRADVAELDAAQAEVVERAGDQFHTLFAGLDLDRPESARDALLEGLPVLTETFGGLSATAAAEWYEDLRAREVGGAFSAQLAALPSEERVQRSVRWAAGFLFEGSPESTRDLLSGSLVRALGDAQRDTVTTNTMKDRKASGWTRMANADGCDFCVMLSQRGAVYKKETADFASHDNCRCRAAPSWDPSAPEVDVRAYEASKKTSGMSDDAKASHRLRVNIWMDENRGMLDQFREELV